MLLRVLGSLHVDGPDGTVSVGGAVPRRLLCALLVRPNAVVSVDGLVAAAWGDHPPRSAERTLVSHLSRLREALAQADGAAPPLLERRDGGYRLVVAPDSVDTGRFEQAVVAMKDRSGPEAVHALGEALALWRSPEPFADLQDTVYPAAEAARLVELHGFAVESLVAAHLEAGEAVSAAALAEARLRDDPYRERLWELLMLALYRQGRQADALAAYGRARAELGDGLGIDPGPALRELEARVLVQDPGLLSDPAPTRHPCPYKGLARYDSRDADLFVGREQLVDEIVARLVDQRYLVVVGSSGAGKSSLVHAGLLPALAAGALPGSGAWSVAVVTPGRDPLPVLDAELANRPDLLVVDQAEEALLADDGARVVAFGERVLAAVDRGTRVVLVLRADFFGLLEGHSALARRSGPATVLVGPPDEQELRRIVVEPAVKVGLRVEPALADLIVREVRDRPGVLPVLSTALVRTWEQRDAEVLSVASYRVGGGVEAALQRVGEEAWAALVGDAQQNACRRLLLRLAVNEDGSWVRRWVRRVEVVPPDDMAAVIALAVLTTHRLVVARAEDISVAHEALLTGWPRLKGWLEDGRSRAAVRERLAVAATSWAESEHDPGELYRGTRLQAALDTAATSPDDLTSLERAFLAESAEEADRQLAGERARADREAWVSRRVRLVAAGLAIALAFAASAGAYAIIQSRQAQRAALAADAGRLGALARSGGAYDRALLLAAQAVALDPSPASESDLFATLLRGDAVLATFSAADSVLATAFSSDDRSVYAVTKAGNVARWPAAGGPSELSLEIGQYAFKLAVAADGNPVVSYVALGSPLTSLDVLDSGDGHVIHAGPVIDPWTWSLSLDGTVVVGSDFMGATPSVVVWRIGTPASDARVLPIDARVREITACGPLTACVTTEDQRLVRVNLSDATLDGGFALPSDTVNGVVGSPDGRTLAITRPDGIVRIIDAHSGGELRQLGGGGRDVAALSFSPDGSQVVVRAFSVLYVWRVDGDGLPDIYDGHGGLVTSADWSTDGSTLVTAGGDGTVIVWDTTGRRRVGAVLTEELSNDTFALWPASDAVVVGHLEGRVSFVNRADGTITTVDPPGEAEVVSVHSDPAGRIAVTADHQGITAVWDLGTGLLLGTVDLPARWPAYGSDVWLSPDGTLAAADRSHLGAVIFDPVARTVVRRLTPLPDQMLVDFDKLLGWTPDGECILISRRVSSGQAELIVVDTNTGAVRLRVPTGDDVVLAAAADPTGRYIAIGVEDGTLRIVDATDGHSLAPPLRANAGESNEVSISPDGRYIATSGSPARVVVWDSRTFRPVGTPIPLDGQDSVTNVQFGQDGRLVVANGKVLRVYAIDPAQWLAHACRVAGRTLTQAEFEEVLPGRPYAPACANV